MTSAFFDHHRSNPTQAKAAWVGHPEIILVSGFRFAQDVGPDSDHSPRPNE
jgi:hypothetical protein